MYMTPKETAELLVDAMRARIRVTNSLIRAVSEYTRERGVQYSPEYIVTWQLFRDHHGVLYAYWDAVRELYDTLTRHGHNDLTRYLDMDNPKDIILYGYNIPATLAGDYLPGYTRKWLVKQMIQYPLLIREWIFATADAVRSKRSIGECMMKLVAPKKRNSKE